MVVTSAFLTKLPVYTCVREHFIQSQTCVGRPLSWAAIWLRRSIFYYTYLIDIWCLKFHSDQLQRVEIVIANFLHQTNQLKRFQPDARPV